MGGNRVALVTGASRGIGRCAALALAKDGFDVAMVYSSNKIHAEAVVKEAEAFGARARAYCCDVADFGGVKSLVMEVTRDLGPVYALVNNAGVTRDKLIMTMSEDDFTSVVDVNLKGAFNLIRHTCAGFVKQRAGRIINISSVSGVCGNAGQANYCASKAGLVGLTKSAAKELAGKGITCNAVVPGIIQTDMTSVLTDEQRQEYIGRVPLKRAGRPEEVANLISFLASDNAGYITGAVLHIDGGLCM